MTEDAAQLPKPKMLRVPVKTKTREMLMGTLEKIENVKTLLVVIEEDDEGVWLLFEDDVTLERMNWMLDRAKRMVHE